MTTVTEAGAGNEAAEAAATSIEPAAKVEGKPEPKVVAIGKETIPLICLKRMKRYPPKKPSRPSESLLQQHPNLRKVLPMLPEIDWVIEMQQEMLRQYENKGYAVMGVERYDNGLKRWFILPEEEAILPEEEVTA